jgi:LuxR family maltose regulon positive regulatory protein
MMISAHAAQLHRRNASKTERSATLAARKVAERARRNVAPLESKLTPPAPRPENVHRAGLINRLRIAHASKVVLISAPPGYGKTTLVADWARKDERQFIWCRLDETDDAVSFVTHLFAAVSRACAPNTVNGFDVPSSPLGLETVVGRLGLMLAAAGTPVVVVLDDVDALQGMESGRLLSRFIEMLPSDSQLVLVSWTEPPVPLARLRASRQLLEFTVDDFRLNNREAAALVHNVGVDLTQPEVDTLNASLEGWAAGLYLAAMSMAAGATSSAAPIGSNALVSDYFRAAFLPSLSGDDIRFLARTSVLDRLCGPFCDAVAATTDSAARLERLARSNHFIFPLDREGVWYRIHPAFRSVLLADLERSEPGLIQTLRSRAAAWSSAHDEPVSALDYAVSAEDVDQLAVLIEQSTLPFSAVARPADVGRWLGSLDDDTLLQGHPLAAIIGALAWAMAGRADVADRWADDAERGFAAASPPAQASSAVPSMPWSALARSLTCPSGPEEMREAADYALDALPLGSVWRAPALFVLGASRALEGDALGAESVLEEAADTAASLGAAAIESVVLGYHSLLTAEQGHWPRADTFAEGARRVVCNAGLENHVASLFSLAANARAALRCGDWAQVHADLDHAETLLPGLTDALGGFSVFIRVELARVHLALGNAAGALHLLDEADEIFSLRPRLGVFRQNAHDVRAQLDLHDRRFAGASPTLTAAELRLLPLLTTHLSFREIGEQLFVSRNTVKTQAISVYRKLGVSSRGNAIACASDLGLIAGEGLPSADYAELSQARP